VFFFQAEDGIRDFHVTGVQTCALPISINRYTEIEFSLQRDRVVGRSFEQALGKSVMGLTQPHMQQAVDSGETVEHDFTWQGEARSEERRVGKEGRSRGSRDR